MLEFAEETKVEGTILQEHTKTRADRFEGYCECCPALEPGSLLSRKVRIFDNERVAEITASLSNLGRNEKMTRPYLHGLVQM